MLTMFSEIYVIQWSGGIMEESHSLESGTNGRRNLLD